MNMPKYLWKLCFDFMRWLKWSSLTNILELRVNSRRISSICWERILGPIVFPYAVSLRVRENGLSKGEFSACQCRKTSSHVDRSVGTLEFVANKAVHATMGVHSAVLAVGRTSNRSYSTDREKHLQNQCGDNLGNGWLGQTFTLEKVCLPSCLSIWISPKMVGIANIPCQYP